MYQCSSCSANLKFDIASQRMLCDHCGASMDPYEVEEKKDALESVIGDDEYEVTVFSCPQCGGELLCYDDTAATFCSYCGGSTILDSRISREKRPQHIIPFKKTKEQCLEAYSKVINRAYFLPEEMRDEDYISKFRSIYMPYWMYSFEKKGPVIFKGVKRRIQDDIQYTEVYKIETEVEAEYTGLTYDASSAFSDALSNAIAPFEWWAAKPFTPAYLSGFYADIGDVSPKLYEEDARSIARNDMCRRMREDPVCQEYEVSELLEEVMLNQLPKVEMAMLPVWFLSFRKDDRVSYAVVNGQTGEVACDLPIDKKSYLRWSCLWALPVALLMVLFLKISAPSFLVLTVILAVICCIISCSQKREIRARENYQDDKGKWYPVTPGKVWRFSLRLGDDVIFAGVGLFVFLIMLGANAIFAPFSDFLVADVRGGVGMGAAFSFMILPVIYKFLPKGVFRSRNTANLTWGDFLDTLKKTGIGVALSLLVLLLKPEGAIIYYLVALLTMGMIVWDVLGIIDRHNLLVTREIPQFRKRGGEADGR